MVQPSTSFGSMAASGADSASTIPRIGIGMLGYAMMGRAHTNAYKVVQHVAWPPPLIPELVGIAGRTREATATAAERYGYENAYTDWRDLLSNPRVDLFDNSGPNNAHLEPTLAALQAGKHVLCEKPLGRTAEESLELWRAAQLSRAIHMVGFNYRFVPAIRLAKEIIASGELGEIYHFRSAFLQEWLADPALGLVWRLDKEQAGSGALGDLGSHIVDLARYLVGEIAEVSGSLKTFITQRDGQSVDVDDAFAATVEFESGATGVLEASRFCLGRKADMSVEVNGSKGSVRFDLARLNELLVHLVGSTPAAYAQGFRNVSVTESHHPYLGHWWPHGHVLGWEHTFVDQANHLLGAIAGLHDVAPHGATFADGYRASVVCDGIAESSELRAPVELKYEDALTPQSAARM